MEPLRIGLAQISPVWLHKQATLQKINDKITEAAQDGCKLVVFGEALLPGYPFWLSFTHASSFESSIQKDIHARYMQEAVQIERGDLDLVTDTCRNLGISCYLGIIERPHDRGGHSLYCSLVYINTAGKIGSVHRKLQPTYEERLCWSPGDGNGLQVHDLGEFRVGGLNCWENWMPLARTSLYAQGENLHIAVWPGSTRNTQDITRFIAKEARSFVASVSGVLTKNDIPKDFPHYDAVMKQSPDVLADGGSCIAGPDGEWVLSPQDSTEDLFVVELDSKQVFRERQNFDASGHYSRPDVTELTVNTRRQKTVTLKPNKFEE